MREIKFRGRRTDNKEWVYGYYIRSTDGRSFIGNEMYVDKKGEYSTATKTFNAIEVDPKTVGQFTGLKDKNRKEIWKGDLVVAASIKEENPNWKKHIKEVKWQEKTCGWNLAPCKGNYYKVGNIYQNPELSKKIEN